MIKTEETATGYPREGYISQKHRKSSRVGVYGHTKRNQCELSADVDGDTALHIAVAQENTEAVLKILAVLKRNGVSPNIKNYLLQAPIHIAIIVDNPRLVECLLQADSTSCQVTDRHGNTSIHLAVKYSTERTQYATLRMLTNFVTSKTLKEKNIYGLAPIHLAAQLNNDTAIEILNQAGADIDALENKGGATALHLAVRSSNFQAAKKILDLGGDPNVRTSYGETAGQVASAMENRRMSELLAFYDTSDVTRHERYLNDAQVAEYQSARRFSEQFEAAHILPEVMYNPTLLRHTSKHKNEQTSSLHGPVVSLRRDTPLLLERIPPKISFSELPSMFLNSDCESETKSSSGISARKVAFHSSTQRQPLGQVMQWPLFSSVQANDPTGLRMHNITQKYLREFQKRMMSSTHTTNQQLPKNASAVVPVTPNSIDEPLDLRIEPKKKTNLLSGIKSNFHSQSTLQEESARTNMIPDKSTNSIQNRNIRDKERGHPPPPYCSLNFIRQHKNNTAIDISNIKSRSSMPVNGGEIADDIRKQKSWSEDNGTNTRKVLHPERTVFGRRNSAPVGVKRDIRKNIDLRSYTGCLPPHFLHLLESSGNLPVRSHNALLEVADVFRPSMDAVASKRATKRSYPVSTHDDHAAQTEYRQSKTRATSPSNPRRRSEDRNSTVHLSPTVITLDTISEDETDERFEENKASMAASVDERETGRQIELITAANAYSRPTWSTNQHTDDLHASSELLPIPQLTRTSTNTSAKLCTNSNSKTLSVGFDFDMKTRHFVTITNKHTCPGCSKQVEKDTAEEQIYYCSRNLDSRYTSAPGIMSPKLVYCSQIDRNSNKPETNKKKKVVMLSDRGTAPISIMSQGNPQRNFIADNTLIRIDQKDSYSKKTTCNISKNTPLDGFTKVSLSDSDYIDYVSEDSGTDTWETDPSLTDQCKKETLLVRKNSLDAKLEKLRFRALVQHQNRYRAAIQADNVNQNIDNDLSDDDLLANSIQDSESECDDLFDVPPARKRVFDGTQEKTAKNTKHNELAIDVKNVYTTPKLNKNKTPNYNTPKTLQAPKYVQSLASTSPALHPAISAYLLPIFPQVAVMKPVYQPVPQFMNGTYTALNKKLVLLINNDLWRAQNDIPRVRVFPPEKRQPTTTSSDEIDLIELEISDDEEAVIRV